MKTAALLAIAALVGAVIGSGSTLLLADHGPRGSQGAQGPAGPPGPAGNVGAVSDQLDALSFQASDLDSRVTDLESSNLLGIDVSDLDSRVSDLETSVSDLCFAVPDAGC